MNKALEEKVLKYIDDNCDVLFRQLSELVKIDTQNFYKNGGNENDGQDYLAKICKEIGVDVDIYAPDSVPGLVESDEYNPGRHTDKRQNLVATLKGEADQNGIMLAAHMDTMPAGDLSKWENDPFSGLIKDGKIYGRGVGDDKFGIALAWFLMKAFLDLGITPKKNILLGSYCDEEGGGGNGALGLCLKHPSECIINLDGKGFEKQALGGGCFNINLQSTLNDKSIASVFDVFTGAEAIVKELEILHQEPNITVRLSKVSCGDGGEKKATISIAIYTDRTKEETEKQLADIFEKVKPILDEQHLASDGFVRTTKFFRYGKTDESSKEAALLTEAIEELTGTSPDTSGSCLSDLSILLHFATANSFNYGIPRGDDNGGGAHQPNEFIECKNLIECTKVIALVLLRM